VSLAAECARAQAAIRRARALFAADPQPPSAAVTAATSLHTAARTTGGAAATMAAESSGQTSDAYTSSARRLSAASTGLARTDRAVAGHLTEAATITRTGARLMDAIAADNEATVSAASAARTPAEQRAILTSLQSQLIRTQEVVNGARHVADQLTGRIQAVDYTTSPAPKDPAPSGPVAPLPDPSQARWDGPPPAGEADKTGFWAVDTSRPVPGPTPLPAPAPYRSAPPPCATLEGGPSGVLTVGGQSPQSQDALGFDLQNTYKFRISGTEFGGQTQMVQLGDQWYQAQWQRYTYEMNKIPVVAGAGDLGALQLPVMSQANQWTPVSLGQIMQENSLYPDGTFYLPNPYGDVLQVAGGGLQLDTPVVPVMTRGR